MKQEFQAREDQLVKDAALQEKQLNEEFLATDKKRKEAYEAK